MKNLFSILFLLMLSLFTPSVSGAASPITSNQNRSAVTLVWVNPSAVSDITKAEDILSQGMEKALSPYHFTFKDHSDAQQMMQEYMIENNLVPDDNKTSVGFLPKKEDLKNLAESANVKYIAFVNARITDEKVKTAWMSWTGSKFEVTTLFTTIIYSVDQDKYIFFKQQSVKENAAGSSSTERAFVKSCETFVNKDLSFSSLKLD
jgi:hypothetical protein